MRLLSVALLCTASAAQEQRDRSAAISLVLRCKQDSDLAQRSKAACSRAEHVLERMQQHSHFTNPIDDASAAAMGRNWSGWEAIESASANELSYEHFFRTHAVARRPLVLLDLDEAATPAAWAAGGLPAVKLSCGGGALTGESSVVGTCADAVAGLRLPRFVANDLLQRAAPGAPRRAAAEEDGVQVAEAAEVADRSSPWAGRWPRVLGGEGSKTTDLAFMCPAQLHGFLSVVSGAIEVLSFDEAAFASLTPRLRQVGILGPTADAGAGAVDVEAIGTDELVAMFSSEDSWRWIFETDPWALKQAHLEVAHASIAAGSAFFAPAGTMASWKATSESFVAVLHCFVDASNFPEVKRALRTEALIDPSAAKLLGHFHAPGFDSASERRPPGSMEWGDFSKWPRVEKSETVLSDLLDAEAGRSSRRLQFREWQLDEQWSHLVAHLTLPTPTAPSVLKVTRDRVSLRWSTPLQLQSGDVHGLAGYELIWEVLTHQRGGADAALGRIRMLYPNQGWAGSHAVETEMVGCTCPSDCATLKAECVCPSACSRSECKLCRSHGTSSLRVERAEFEISDVGAHTVVANVHGIDPGHAYVFRVALLVLSNAPRVQRGGADAVESPHVKHRLRRGEGMLQASTCGAPSHPITSVASSVPGAIASPPVVIALSSSSTLSVAWAAPLDDGGLGIYAYILEIHPVRGEGRLDEESSEDAAKRRSGALSSKVVVKDSASLRRAKTTVSDLISGMSYEIRIAAVNSAGTGEFSVYSAPVRTSVPAPVASEDDAGGAASRPNVVQISGKGGGGGGGESESGDAGTTTSAGAASDEGGAAASKATAAAGAGGPLMPCFGPTVVLSDSRQLLSIDVGAADLLDAKVWASAFSPKTYDVNAEAVLAAPVDGDVKLTNSELVQDRIVVMRRGKVPLHVKVKHAQEAGALGVVIVDTGRCDKKFDQRCSQGADKSRGEGFAAEDDKALWEKYHIPSVLIQRQHAHALGLYADS